MDSTLKSAIRLAFDKAAGSYDDAAFLQREIALRLDERLEWMKIAPRRLLDAGCGTGRALPLLRARYPEADLVALDLAPAMLAAARQALPAPSLSRRLSAWLNPAAAPGVNHVCADIERLPLATDSFDLIWSNVALQWVGDLEATFRGLNRVLRPGGLFAFTTFGPDTLQELRAAFAGLDGYGHVNRFVDMHDVGDMLLHAGFADPVMEMERITLTYADLKTMLRELKAIGAHTVLDGRRSGLMGRREWQRLADNYERFRQAGRLPATYEVIYGHAWGGDRRQDGRQVIQWRMAQSRQGAGG